jgi:hypothetical protein
MGLRQATASVLTAALIGVWSRAGSGNKINLLDTIPFLPLAF